MATTTFVAMSPTSIGSMADCSPSPSSLPSPPVPPAVCRRGPPRPVGEFLGQLIGRPPCRTIRAQWHRHHRPGQGCRRLSSAATHSDWPTGPRRLRSSSHPGRPCPTCLSRLGRSLGLCRSPVFWKALHTASTVESACRGPTTCKPTGSPAEVSPHGMLAAGCWVKLNG